MFIRRFLRVLLVVSLLAAVDATPEPLGENDPASTPGTRTARAFSDEVLDHLIAVPATQLAAAQNSQDTPSPRAEVSLFESLNIDVSDLERLRQRVEERFSGKKVRYSLMDVVRRSLEVNHDILIAAYEPQRAQADVEAARGDFDPVLSADVNFSKSKTSASAQTVAFGGISSIRSYMTTMQLALNGRIPIGTQYTISLDITKEETTFNQFIEEFNGGIRFTLTQPVLRGRGTDVNLARLRIAKKSRAAADSQFELSIMNVTADVIKAYWDLVGAMENQRVRLKSLDNAKRLVEINEKRLAIGTAARIDVLQAKAGLATRSSDVITARVAIADGEDRLKQLLDIREGSLFTSDRVIPTDRPNVVEVPLDETKSTELALRYRPEVRTAELDIESAGIDERRARNDLLPQLDFSASYFQGGRDHKLRQVFDAIRGNDDDAFSFSIQGSIPIGNHAARGGYLRARLTTRQAEQRLEKTKQEVMLSVRAAIRGVLSSEALVESNKRARQLQEANVAAEEKKLSLGTTTSQIVLQIEEDLTLAETQEVRSMIDYEKSLVDLQVSEGTLLSNLGIEYEDAELVPPVSYWKGVFAFWPRLWPSEREPRPLPLLDVTMTPSPGN